MPASIRERFAKAVQAGDVPGLRAAVTRAAALGDLSALRDLKLLNHYDARAQGDLRRAPFRKAA